jgi:hypothetical protein
VRSLTFLVTGFLVTSLKCWDFLLDPQPSHEFRPSHLACHSLANLYNHLLTLLIAKRLAIGAASSVAPSVFLGNRVKMVIEIPITGLLQTRRGTFCFEGVCRGS